MKAYDVYNWRGGDVPGFGKDDKVKAEHLPQFIEDMAVLGFNIMIVNNVENPYIAIDTYRFQQR